MKDSKIINNEENTKKYFILAIFIISLIPLVIIYKSQMPIIKWNDAFTGLYSHFYYNQQYTWNYVTSAGVPSNFYSAILFPGYLMNTFFRMTQLPIYFVQAIQLGLSILLSLMGVFLLTRDLLKETDVSRRINIISFITAIFYVFNFYSLINIFYRGAFFIFIPPILPLSLLFLFRSFKFNKNYYVLLAAIIPAISTVMFMSPGYGIIIYAFIGLFFISFYIFSEKHRKIIAFKYISLIILLNLFWVVPALSFLNYAISDANSMNYPIDAYNSLTNSQKIINSIRLVPDANSLTWKIKGFSGNEVFYNNILFMYFSLIPLFLLIFSLLFLKKNTQKKYYTHFFLILIFLLLICVFISKAGNSPFSILNKYFFVYTTLGKILSNPDKIPYAISLFYTILIPFSLILTQKYVIKKELIIYSLIILIIFTASFSFWDGKIFTDNIVWGNSNISSYVETPKTYYDLKNSLDEKKLDFKLLFLPLIPKDMPTFKWDQGYLADDFRKTFFNRGTFIDKHRIPAGDISIKLLDEVYNKENNSPIIAMQNNILFVGIQYDLDLENGNYGGEKMKNPDFFKTGLSNYSNQIINNTNFNIYKINSELFLAHFYTPQNIIISNKSVESIIEIVAQPDYQIRSVVIFTNQTQNLDKKEIIKNLFQKIEDTPLIEFKKITSYGQETKDWDDETIYLD